MLPQAHIAANAILIAILSLAGFLFPAIMHLQANNIAFTFSNIANAYDIQSVLVHGQTYAFTILAIIELFHAIGARDEHNSIFKFKLFDNKMMIVAFLVGLLGQVAVTEIPFLTNIFGTTSLSIVEWIYIFGVASLTLVLHEVTYLLYKIKNKKGAKKLCQ